MTKKQFEKYIDFMLNELTGYMEDHTVTDDEFQLCTNELRRFKELCASSGKLPEPIKKEIARITFKKGVKKEEANSFFEAFFAFRTRRDPDYIGEVDLLEDDLRRIFHVIKLIN